MANNVAGSVSPSPSASCISRSWSLFPAPPVDCIARKSVVDVSVIVPELAVVCEAGGVLQDVVEAGESGVTMISAMLAVAAILVDD